PTATLASRRQPLGPEGDVVFQVPSLGVPKASAARDTAGGEADGAYWLSTVVASEAVRLFSDRAAAVMPSFRSTPGNAHAVLDICWRLDGIPLAIELAASRVTVLSVEEIDAGLGDRFRLLTSGRRV